MTAKPLLVAAMSGGVDSSVAAELALEDGFDVVGVTLKLKDCDDSRERVKACCGVDDFLQVRMVAEKLGIPHYFLDLKDEFRENVLQYAWDEYRIGRTPNPCSMCNFHLKFGHLIDYARKLGAVGLITGHYANLDHEKGELSHAADRNKDQVYFLSLLTAEQLRFCRMPLGQMTKSQVRRKAEELGLENAERQESQDACFGYKGESFSNTLANYFGEKIVSGDIIDTEGRVLGRHNGIHQYTIGQRKGLGIAMGEPAYVVKIDAENNRVVLSTDNSLLMADEIEIKDVNLSVKRDAEFECQVQTRYRQLPVTAQAKLLPNNRAFLKLHEPVSAPALGQVAAFYDADLVLGGGIIDATNQGKI